ncbi:MAG: molybdenum cofactor biosynthesis protein MoaE [Henriciella sp.]
MIELRETGLCACEALQAFEARVDDAGAIVSFSGRVRRGGNGGDVTCLHLQAYSPLTERGMTAAADQAMDRWPLTALSVIHRIGDMAPGETIVFVATAARHRRDAFEAADFLMDYLKTEAVFWKKETTPSGDNWIEPRAQDYQDQARWARNGDI